MQSLGRVNEMLYKTNKTCPDCKNTLVVTWEWPAIVLGEPVKLHFICLQCAGVHSEQAMTKAALAAGRKDLQYYTAEGKTMVERHYDVYKHVWPMLVSPILEKAGDAEDE